MRARNLVVVVVITVGIMLAVVAAADASTRPSASCYGPGLYGNRTANGTTLRTSTLGVAHKTLPFGMRLTLRSNGREVTVKIIDRGPFIAGRHLDLTEATVRALGYSGCASWGHRPLRSWRAR